MPPPPPPKCYLPPPYQTPPDNNEIRAAALCSGGVSRLAAAAFAMVKTTSPSEATMAVTKRNSLDFSPGFYATCATTTAHPGTSCKTFRRPVHVAAELGRETVHT